LFKKKQTNKQTTLIDNVFQIKNNCLKLLSFSWNMVKYFYKLDMFNFIITNCRIYPCIFPNHLLRQNVKPAQ